MITLPPDSAVSKHHSEPSIRQRGMGLVCGLWAILVVCTASVTAEAAGEPAREFLTRLRQAKMFDTAVDYLDRLDQYPGVDPALTSAIDLEKAQTYIDAAVASRDPKTRDGFFQQAEEHLQAFLSGRSHPRMSEARLQLGRLQMARAGQLLSGTPDESDRRAARASYLDAAQTFDRIVEQLRSTLKQMQGARIDPAKDPQAADLRDQYRGEFLQAMSNSAESRLLAARTFDDPKAGAKSELERALATYNELSEKYGGYVPGAISLAFRGQVQEILGRADEAVDSYIRMLEQPEADALREAKLLATTGLVRHSLAQSPPNYEQAISRGQPMLDGLREDEWVFSSAQELRIQLAKAHLGKSADEQVERVDRKRSETSARTLLLDASKAPGPLAEEANRLLVGMGIDVNAVVEIPEVENPDSLEDALDQTRALLAAGENLTRSLQILEGQDELSDELEKQIADINKQLAETQVMAIQVLQRGLALTDTNSDREILNQSRQYLAYLLYQQKFYRDAAVVGGFLARNAPGSDVGLRGGLLALNSMQVLVVENPDNEGLAIQLERLGTYLTKTWPSNPDVGSAQGVMITVALRNERWDEARQLIEKLAKPAEQAFYRRLMGQLLWNQSIQLREKGEDEAVDAVLQEAAKELRLGLDGLTGEPDADTIKASLTLAKILLRQQRIAEAADALDHNAYGAVRFASLLNESDPSSVSDLYSTELQIVVQQMTSEQTNSDALLERAIQVMEKLRDSVSGEDAQKRLTSIYLRMARDIREQLDNADPASRKRLVDAFRIFLDRIAATSEDAATLRWVARTLMELAEASMPNPESKAQGQAADLLNTAVKTLERLKDQSDEESLTIDYQLGKSHRLLGNYQAGLDVFEKLLAEKPLMLDAQMEAALAYEQWAAEVPPKFKSRAYEAALAGGRPNAQKQNVIWGWGKISQLTSGDPKYREVFFKSRYRVALCRFLLGKASKKKAVVEKSLTDITKVHALYPEMGGKEQRAKFDRLLKSIQTELGRPPVGLAPGR